MDLRDVERIARDVLVHEAPQWSVAAVEASGDGWLLTLNGTSGARAALVLPVGPPATIRARVSQWIEEHAG